MKNKQNDIFLVFMQETIEKVNRCLSSLYTIHKLLIEKGLITEKNLINRLNEDKDKPIHDLGKKVLNEMIKNDL